MSYLLGIDVGTTRTAAAITRLDGGRIVETEMVNLGDRSVHVPSVLFVGADGGVVVGEAAERRALTDPDRVVREFKRRVGDPTPIQVAGQPWTPEDLSARLVRWVVDQVAAREGGVAERISVTHPASWGNHKKELFATALARVGLTVTFLAEPQAAALHYASAERVEQGATIAVYDLGGGTFDAAVVRKDGTFGLLGRPEGIERLGGIDFDQVVFDHVVEGMPDAFADLDETDPSVLSAVARIRRDCTEAKEALSSDTEASVPVLLPGTQGSVRLHRSEFEQMIGPQIEETVAALRRAISSAGLTPEQMSAVLLVGGSSRIPLVAQTVSDELGRPSPSTPTPRTPSPRAPPLRSRRSRSGRRAASPRTPPRRRPARVPRVRLRAGPWRAGRWRRRAWPRAGSPCDRRAAHRRRPARDGCPAPARVRRPDGAAARTAARPRPDGLRDARLRRRPRRLRPSHPGTARRGRRRARRGGRHRRRAVLAAERARERGDDPNRPDRRRHPLRHAHDDHRGAAGDPQRVAQQPPPVVRTTTPKPVVTTTTPPPVTTTTPPTTTTTPPKSSASPTASSSAAASASNTVHAQPQ
ncbi:Hsp70 family protein [Pseudonocardia benzenivorans]